VKFNPAKSVVYKCFCMFPALQGSKSTGGLDIYTPTLIRLS